MTDTITTTAPIVFTHALRYKLADELLDAGESSTLSVLQHTRPGTVLEPEHELVTALRAHNLI